jgi:hypothetical protein
LTCESFSTIYEGSVRVGLFTIRPLKGKESLLEIIKAKNVAENFPITRETEEEAFELLEKLLGDC